MSGKRLLDIVALVNASRGVAKKHVALRARQLDVYNRTSTLTRAVRSQRDRVTETVKAASILASRLNEKAPEWASDIPEESSTGQSHEGEPIPSRESTDGTSPSKLKDGLEQDHFYERSMKNSTVDEPPKDDSDIQQETADRYPLPDGMILPRDSDINTAPIDHDIILERPEDEPSKRPVESEGFQPVSTARSSIPKPSQKHHLSPEEARAAQRQSELQIPSKAADAFDDSVTDPLEDGHGEDTVYRRSTHTSPTLSSLPRAKIPKHISDVQEGDGHLLEKLNSETFYSAGKAEQQIPSVEAVPEQEEIPEGVNTELFYSPRVTRLLGGKAQGSKKSDLELKGAKATPVEHTKVAEGKDQDTFNVRTSPQSQPTTPETSNKQDAHAAKVSDLSKEEIESLAQDISKENPDVIKVHPGITTRGISTDC
jgi:aarF domain-containing kinase